MSNNAAAAGGKGGCGPTGLEALARAVAVAPALVRFFAALRPDFLILPVRRDPGLLDLLPQIRERDVQQ